MKKIIVVRGLPGSGKTTLAKELAERFKLPYYEADQYFTDLSGKYRFDPSQLGAAHSYCWGMANKTLYQKGACIVSNTFTTKK